MAYLSPAAPWILVDWINAAALTNATFTSGGNGVNNYPVNGNLDGGYHIFWQFSTPAAGLGCTLLLQGSSVNENVVGNGTNGAGNTNLTSFSMGVCAATAAIAGITPTGLWTMEKSITGVTRMAWFVSNVTAASPGFGEAYYSDSGTVITNIRLAASTGTMTGSIFLYVKTPQHR